MGIHRLSGYLKKGVSATIRLPVTWTPGSYPAGTRWAVDTACLVFSAQAAGLSPLTLIASLIVRMRRAGVEPIFIFEGRGRQVAKTAVMEQRSAARAVARERTVALEEELATTPTLTEAERGEREVEIAALRSSAPSVTRSMWNDIKQFLYSAGVLGVSAAMEADDLLGWLARQGVVSAVVSTDYDMLARGVPVMITPDTPDCTVWSRIELTALLRTLQVTYPQFVRACVSMGCDYSPPGWRGFYPAVAIRWAQTGGSWERFGEAERATLEQAEALLMGEGVEWGPALLDERQMGKWTAGAPTKEPEAMDRRFVANMWPLDWRPWL